MNMSTTMQCNIVSAEKSIFSGTVEMLVATGDSGELGILANHTPLLTGLIPGPVKIVKEGGEEEVFYVSGGYLEVQPKIVSILADTALRADDIDEAAAKEAQQNAEKAVLNQTGEFDYSVASAQLAEAAAQLRAIQKLRNKFK